MSLFWKPTPYGPHRRETEWVNLCITSHDMMCGCDHPGDHLLLAVAQRSGYLKINKDNLEKATKCLTSTTDHASSVAAGDHQEEEDPISTGDLEQLFAEDTFYEDEG